MKKVEIKGKLNLDKMTVANLDNTVEVSGGGFLTIGKRCKRKSKNLVSCSYPK